MTPTRTALALALTAAALVLGAPAAASAEECGFADPEVPGGWVATDCFTAPEDHPGFREDPESYEEDYTPQLPEERIGGYRCPDPAMVIVSLNPDVCAYPVPAAQVPDEPIGDAGGDASVTVDTAPSTAPTAAAPTAAAPADAPAVTAEGLAEWIRSILWTHFRWLFYGTAR